MFFWLLKVATCDSYILYKIVEEQNNKTSMTHKQYRLSLIKDLVTRLLDQILNLNKEVLAN